MNDVTLESQLFDIIKSESMEDKIKLAKLDMLAILGVDINAKKKGKSALIWAKEAKNEKVIEFLNQRGAKEEQISKEEIERLSKLLHSSFPNVKEMEKFIEQGADINYIEDEMDALLFAKAINEKKWDVADLLLLNGQDINIIGNGRYSNGHTQLSTCSARNDIEAVEMLIKRGADLNVKSDRGMTALMWATINDNIEVVKLLVDAGTNIDDVSDIGYSALGWAVASEHKEIIEYLLEKGADATIKDIKGYNMTTFTKNEEIKRIIKNAISEKNKEKINSFFHNKIKQGFRM